jgi:sugar phosphate isomerase/epimerase
MIPSISNIALPAYEHSADLSKLAEIGYGGLEVAPSRVWEDTWKGLSNESVTRYRSQIENAGLTVVGLHSLVFDHPELQLFGDVGSTSNTLQFMIHLSSVCRDLGGKTLIWGGGRRRGNVPPEDAFKRAVEFMITLCDKTAEHGTTFCFEPLGPSDSDFINSVLDAKEFAETVNRPNHRIQIDAKALVENDEIDLNIFNAVASEIVHFHANEPGLVVIGRTNTVDHARIGEMLRGVHYNGFISAEQRMLSETTYIEDARESFVALEKNYSPIEKYSK